MHHSIMEDAKQKLGGILRYLENDYLVYIDIPIYFNIGDLLINIGTEAYIREHALSIRSRYSLHDLGAFDPRAATYRPGYAIAALDAHARNGAVFVLQGGGNVGDIWPASQTFREMLIRRYPNTKFVQLPQSVHFNDGLAQKRSAALYRSHGGVIFFVRDTDSLVFAREEAGCDGGLMPDMAHQLWRSEIVPPTWGSGAKGILSQIRRDEESAAGVTAAGSFDWGGIVGPREKLGRYAYRAIEAYAYGLHDRIDAYRFWYSIRDRVVQRAIDLFAQRSEIHTDRLHGLILASLQGTAVRFYDNSYGKLSRYYESWLKGSDRVSSHGNR